MGRSSGNRVTVRVLIAASVVAGAVVSCGDGGTRSEGVSSSIVSDGDRSTAVYEIRMQVDGSDVLVVHAADAGEYESLDVHVPAAGGVPEQHTTAVWYGGMLYESTAGPDGGPDYTVYDPATPIGIVGATLLGEFTARAFVASVEAAYQARSDRSGGVFDFVGTTRRRVAQRSAAGIDWRTRSTSGARCGWTPPGDRSPSTCELATIRSSR